MDGYHQFWSVTEDRDRDNTQSVLILWTIDNVTETPLRQEKTRKCDVTSQ